MPNIQTAHGSGRSVQAQKLSQPTHVASGPLSPRLVLLLASGAGFAVASLYYAQPMLGVLGEEVGANVRTVGLVPTLTQLGYALGILLLAPLGDKFDRRNIILAKAGILGLALLLAGTAPSIGVLLMASLVIGLAATMAQDIVPAAATLAPEHHRGKVVGTVMTGLLLGILLSRVVSGFIAEHFGWRAMFIAAASSIGFIAMAFWRGLPRFHPTTRLSYGALLGSLIQLWTRHDRLRRAAIAQGLLAIGFSAFWSTLAVMLHGAPFHLGSAAAGAFGLAGAAGALAAPIAGRIADRQGPELVTKLGVGLVVFSFAVMVLAAFMPVEIQLVMLVIGAVGFDLGFQATLIAHQTIIYGIDQGARSRLNAVLFVAMFLGMAIGSAVGSWLFAAGGWTALTAFSTASAMGALVVRLRESCRTAAR